MSIKPLSTEEAKGTINVIIFQELNTNPKLTPKELYENMKNYKEYILVQKIFPTLEYFIEHLKNSNFIK